jgi:hypothetical protein
MFKIPRRRTSIFSLYLEKVLKIQFMILRQHRCENLQYCKLIYQLFNARGKSSTHILSLETFASFISSQYTYIFSESVRQIKYLSGNYDEGSYTAVFVFQVNIHFEMLTFIFRISLSMDKMKLNLSHSSRRQASSSNTYFTPLEIIWSIYVAGT